MSNLHQPVPTGGTPGYFVKVDSAGEALCDGPFTLIVTGSGGALTQGQIGGSGPVSATAYWIKIGKDVSTGGDVFTQVWM